MKHHLPFLILLALAVSNTVLAKPLRETLTAEDGTSYPLSWENVGISADSMIRYTSAWGPTTPDNRWARSVLVENGRVSRVVASGEAPIPAEGFVLTGHGRAATWLRAHLLAGKRVSFKPAPPFAEHSVQRAVDAIDPSRDLPAGGRQTNQLVVFTAKRGQSTDTNIFGAEAVVRGNRITALNGGDSPIPEDGFVLSGHGRGSAWIVRYCQVGDQVALKDDQLSLTRDRESAFLDVTATLATARERVTSTKGGHPGREEALALLTKAAKSLAAALAVRDADPEAAFLALKVAERLAWRSAARLVPSPKTELRGVWVGSGSLLKTSQARGSFFTNLASAHINAIFPQATGFLREPEDEARFEAFIAAAHAAGIEVHLWTWLPTHAVPRSRDKTILAEHPEWADRSRDGKALKTLDPANPAARAALAAEAVRIVTRFRLDGIHLDWEGTSGGFSPLSMAQFKKRHGYDPLERTGAEAANTLYQWRANLIRQTTVEVVAAVRKVRPAVRISGALQHFTANPTPGTDRGVSHQWFQWVDEGLLDMACPMLYAQDLRYIDAAVGRIQAHVKGKALHCPGLILYPETAQCGLITPFLLLDQIETARRHAVDGVVLFSHLQLWQEPWAPDDRLLMTLREGPFGTKSALPWAK